MGNHFANICRVHDVILSQCRCMSPDKQRRLVDCPGISCPGAKLGMPLPPDADGNAGYGTVGDTTKQFDLAIYTLRFRAPISWDDEQTEAITESLTNELEITLQAVSSHFTTRFPDVEMVIEQ